MTTGQDASSATTAPGAATLKDVAERAGVSMSSVSRVLAGTYPTSQATRDKVLAAVRDLDYAANASARALAGAPTKTVAIVAPSLASEFYAHIAQGVEEQATADGRICLVSGTGGDSQREAAILRLMREQRTEVVILVGGAVADEEYQTRLQRYAHSLAAAGSQLVLIGRSTLGPGTPAISVEYDNHGGAYAATSYLLSQGHERILYLGQRAGHSTPDARLDGHLQALTAHGGDDDPSLIVPGAFGRYAGYEMIRARLDAMPVDFSAVFAGDDPAAAGAIHALRERGLGVPDDVSIVGYDDLPVAADLRLTTVQVPHEELGRTAVRLALHRGDVRDPSSAVHRMLGTHLVIRESVRPRSDLGGAGRSAGSRESDAASA